jgi:allophanate hydrolase subunit 1
MEQALKHWKIAASAGDCTAMNNLTIKFEQGADSRETIDSTLVAYNSSCVEMRSEARDTSIQIEYQLF